MTTCASLEERASRMRNICRAAGIKLTPQRLEVFREVARNQDHPDAETVFHGVQRRMPTVSLDTVYRTLWLFSDLGLIKTLGPRRESVRFDANLDPHHHYVCTQCGLARDFVAEELDAIAIPDEVRRLGSVVATHVEVLGVCMRCMSKGKKRGRRQEDSGLGG